MVQPRVLNGSSINVSCERKWLNISNTIANSAMAIDKRFVHMLHKNLLQSRPVVYYSARGETLPGTSRVSQHRTLVLQFLFKPAIFL